MIDGMKILGMELGAKGLEVFDITMVEDIINGVKSCSALKGLECGKALLGPISVFDPTGIAGIARAFMYPVCEDNWSR